MKQFQAASNKKRIEELQKENERLNKTIGDLLETGSSKLNIKHREELQKENDQLKKKISESIIGLETIRGLLFHGNGEGKFKNMIDYLDRIISKSQNIKP